MIVVLLLGPMLPSVARATTRTVTNTSDSGAGSLRGALASAQNGDTIDFAPGVTGTIKLTTGPLSIGNGVTIIGPGADVLTVDNGGAGPNGGVFVVNNLSAPVALSGVTITGGNIDTTGTGAGVDYGGTKPLTLSGVVVSGNSASNPTAGGVSADAGGVRDDGSGLMIEDSTISGNTVSSAGNGGNAGGIYNVDASLTLINTTIANNNVTGSGTNPDGGGVLNVVDLTAVNATVAGNSAESGTGGLQMNSASNARLANTIIATNTGSTAPDCSGSATTSTSQGYNLIGNGAGCGFTAGTGDQVGSSASPINPLLDQLANNGGPTPTMALSAGSPAVDAGNPAAVSNAPPPSPPALVPCPTTDQRGSVRPDIPGTACDIGAYEFQQPQHQLTVTKSGTGSGTVTSSPAGIDCGTTCSAGFNSGATVTLTATPGAGSVFAGWGGACAGTGACQVTMTADINVTAAFTATTPTITAISPTHGPAAGGTTVTITGTNLTGATAVSFGATAAATFTVDGATQITATAPAGAAGTVDITVITPGGTSATSAADHYTYIGPPSATITYPSDNQTFDLNQVVAASFACSEAPGGPGLQSCTDSNGGRGVLDTSTTGAHTYTVTATSMDGQVGSATVHYTVVTTAPAVGSASTSPTSAKGANLSGSVDPNGETTTAYWQYGLDPSDRGPGASATLYDQSTTPQLVGSDSSIHVVTATLSGLVPGALYHIRLVASSSAGTTFGPDQTFTTPAAPAPPAPVLGRNENAAPVSGQVFVLVNGQFVRLTGNQQIPAGAVIDALHGTLTLTTAVTGGGGARDAAATGNKSKGKTKTTAKTQTGTFGGAVFKITQATAGANRGLATLSIVEGAFAGAPSYATCKAHKATDATAASSRTLQLLHASAHGKFRTKGRYSAATVLGTKWTVADRCDGTLTHDITDSVSVTDFVRHKTIVLHAGQSYLAKAPGKHP